MTTDFRIADRVRSDVGFGLIETVVSMFLIAILAILFLPLLIQGLKQSAANTTLATATRLVSEGLRLAELEGPDCALVESREGTVPFTDPRGVVIEVTTVVGPCPAPGTADTVQVDVTAVRTDTGAELANAATRVLVS